MMDSSNGSSSISRPLLVAFGNPLLDMTAVVEDQSLHERFSLPTDGQLEVSEEQKELFNLVQEQYDVSCSAGGCALNSSRVFTWVLGQPKKALFMGGIGVDEAATRLLRIIHDSGVNTRMLEVTTESTGRCVALVLGVERCLCADIGAANYCPPEHVFQDFSISDNASELRPCLEDMALAPLLYVEGYFITHSFDTALMIAKYAKENKKTLIFNLCGSYVCENHPEELKQILPYVDILFGFVEEYKTLAKHVDLPALASAQPAGEASIVTSLPSILQAVSKYEAVVIAPSNSCADLAMNLSSQELDSSSRKESVVTNGSPDSENSNSHYFDNSEVLYDSDDPVSPSNEQVNILSIPPGKRKRSEKRKSKKSDSVFALRKCSDTSPCGTTNGTVPSMMRDKVVVMTQGSLPLMYVASDGIVREKHVAPLSVNSIVDTTGAGDSFVGGFLACLSVGRCLEDCIEGGMWAARQILQQKGCTIPQYPAEYLTK
ncbi:hypothetical protein HAZT_HAZT003811 [Hyalella azteca]|nr:adenosine kinase-like isoform X2 [Hyalella azteca]XP_018017907.1 adenosine kinase-like isoform X2 [Hyalella azteca]XP_047741454.1 adenosine kinase-like isoform X2 [Hyalella azteca]KAA0203189.1 hypothetical protein HAZT_HAZT003811 [Hyalella azteca]